MSQVVIYHAVCGVYGLISGRSVCFGFLIAITQDFLNTGYFDTDTKNLHGLFQFSDGGIGRRNSDVPIERVNSIGIGGADFG